MNLRVIKAGVLDSVQDRGRKGFQHVGVNPGGVMDSWSASIANILAGNPIETALIEIHFPASEFLFETAALIAITGADFTAHINGDEVPMGQPLLINRFSILQFFSRRKGARAYLAIHGGLKITQWLGSSSTNIKAMMGGYQGRSLQKNDSIGLNPLPEALINMLGKIEFDLLPWKAEGSAEVLNDKRIMIIEGPEWSLLEKLSVDVLTRSNFSINVRSDRMGYLLDGPSLKQIDKSERLSSSVNFGTIQLLPEGQLIILMADHQTTGGYPRVANVITAHLPLLAQRSPGDVLNFELTDLATAQSMTAKQRHHLLQLKNACTFKLEKHLRAG